MNEIETMNTHNLFTTVIYICNLEVTLLGLNVCKNLTVTYKREPDFYLLVILNPNGFCLIGIFIFEFI